MQAVVNTADVDLIEAVKVFRLGAEDIPDMRHPGVVHEGVEAGQPLEGRADGFGLRHVHTLDRTRAAGGDELIQSLGGGVDGEFENTDIESVGGELQGGGAADAGASSGDDGYRFFVSGVHDLRKFFMVS